MEIFFGVAGSILALLLLTSFIKFLTALNILRYGVGLSDAPFGLVITGVALVLTAAVWSPVIEGSGGVDKLLAASHSTVPIEKSFRPFLEKHADPTLVARLTAMFTKGKEAPAADADPAVSAKSSATPFSILSSAFLISELRKAFTLGLMFLVPFVIIDLAVANLLMALGVVQLNVALVSLPLKLILFVAVDGWTLVTEKLLSSYL